MPGPDPLRLLPLPTLGAFAAGRAMRMLDPILPLLAAHSGVQVAGLAGVIAGFALGHGGGQVRSGRWPIEPGKGRTPASRHRISKATEVYSLPWSL